MEIEKYSFIWLAQDFLLEDLSVNILSLIG